MRPNSALMTDARKDERLAVYAVADARKLTQGQTTVS
jgi:hypothetical protein